ncbi:MAG: hypothetical protein CMM94_03810 [Rickettsiales bacterium]|nr:hypothetical protein [Rickettsiales bacterium]
MATTQGEIKELKQHIANLEDMLSTHVKETGNGSSTFSAENLKGMAHNAGENLRSYVSDKRAQLDDVRATTEATIAKRPFASTAVAFGAGAVIAALLSRRS